MVDNGILLLSIIGIALAIIFVWYFLMKYVFKNIVLGDSISPAERFTILEETHQRYLTHRVLSAGELKNAPFELESLFIRWSLEATRYEFVETLDSKTEEHRFFWLIGKASVLFFPFNKSRLELKEEVRPEIINQFKSILPPSEIIVSDCCPACGSAFSKKEAHCIDCGLVIK
ncbi:hypothetical protein EAX61_06020 [Dokdonia sinensis]|uniref:Uncharacterized protein n=1 Tax=Dokdonia sinensis TaxID=2479847 RepID=A0A3M0GEE3_9FLAO|nr:hypothetical protein [Dokdonia sinensis]RMB61032.1 hypothetical protein EAX61_06020 [Dokdonia sinensis]